MSMKEKIQVLILGSGKIGVSIAKLLSKIGNYKVVVADISSKSFSELRNFPQIKTVVLDVVSEKDSLDSLAKESKVVLSALSYSYNILVAESCARVGASYFDLTEDVQTTKKIREISKSAVSGQVFVPQCGLAPGFVGIVGNDLATRLDNLDTLHMRVGALPMYPSNMLKYNLTWSTDGLINEYCNPCEVIYQGQVREVLPLEGLEYFSVDGIRYEAFNTSGGLGTLCETWSGKSSNINYKTVRYVGHNELIKFLVNELKLNNRRKLLKGVLERSIPITNQDVVVVFCTVTGQKDGKLIQITDARKIYHADLFGEPWSAIQITTAAGACVMIDLFLNDYFKKSGFISQEEVSLSSFLDNRFGKYYKVNNNEITVKPVDVVIEGLL
jgi:saccharopine dehydrogenase-like NADP-dependent oxidoreductase